MDKFIIMDSHISRDIHNAIVTIQCQLPNKSIHEVKVYVANIFMEEKHISESDSDILDAAISWATLKLREAKTVTDISELWLHN